MYEMTANRGCLSNSLKLHYFYNTANVYGQANLRLYFGQCSPRKLKGMSVAVAGKLTTTKLHDALINEEV